MTESRLTEAQKRILAQAVEARVYAPTGSRIATCRRLETLGLLRASGPYNFRPTVAGSRWLEKRATERRRETAT
ncbi:hypothetical protein WMF38_57175 [Sorangium sp. So ce118]